MNIIFITLSNIISILERNLYTDLMRKFRDEGHTVYIVSPGERRNGISTQLMEVDGVHVLKVKTLNIQKTNLVEKGIGTLMIESQFQRAIGKYLSDVRFDLILYSTPPITFANVVRYLKKKNPQAVSYLLLKDIFPQNAVDIGMFGKKSLLYWHFRRKEMALYKASDYIGCMSPANVDFLRRHNPYYPAERVEVAPNSVILTYGTALSAAERDAIRAKYNLPKDKPVFVYGGNLGRPQGIDYIISCLEANKNRTDCFFLIVGDGTECYKLTDWYERQDRKEQLCVRLLPFLPKKEYNVLERSCDVGMIFLDHRFTIPNYPSRLLGYLESKLPVLCATDVNTDVSRIAQENGYGYWCESVRAEDFTALVDKMLQSDRRAMGERGYEFLTQNYLVEHTYGAIVKHL